MSELPLLRYSSLHAGMVLGPVVCTVSPDAVQRYAALTGDNQPIHHDARAATAAGLPAPVLPPGFLGVLARRSYLAHHRMPPGGIMTGQTFELHQPITVGASLTLRAHVLEHEPADPKRRVRLRCEVLADGDKAATVWIDARWPADTAA